LATFLETEVTRQALACELSSVAFSANQTN